MRALLVFLSFILVGLLITSYLLGSHILIESLDLQDPLQKSFLYAFGALFTFCFLFRRRISYWAVLKHELTHNLFAVLTFNKPMGLSVQEHGEGYFQYSGRDNLLISLSPYFFPFTSFIVLLFWLLTPNNQNVYFAILGGFAGFDLATSVKDIHPGQTDFNPYGYPLSILIAALGIIIFYGSILGFVIGGVDYAKRFLEEGLWNTLAILKQFWHFIDANIN